MKLSIMGVELEFNKVQSKWQSLTSDKWAGELEDRQYNEEDAKEFFDWYGQNQPKF